MKTTNAKGGQLKTPAPVKQSAQKTVSPRLRRARVKIHHEEAPKMAQEEPEVPEIEYMAPRSHRKSFPTFIFKMPNHSSQICSTSRLSR